MKRERRPKKKRIWLRVTGIIALLIILGGGAYVYSVWHSLNKAVDTMSTPIEREKSDKRKELVSLSNKEPFSVLMLGVDERKGDRGRSDTMIVMTVNPNEENTHMLSIPRDTRTEIVGRGTEDKINHAYAFGGVEMAMNTVENFLDIPIDYFIKVNMEGFQDIVDAVGGVTVNNNLDFSVSGKHFPKGNITLNGADALKYARMRYEDPNGDFGRQQRQRQIIQAVMKEGASVSSLTNYGDIFGALSKNVQTNLTFDQMMDIQKNYRSAASNLEQETIKETGTKIGGIYYGIVAPEEKTRLQELLKQRLEIK